MGNKMDDCKCRSKLTRLGGNDLAWYKEEPEVQTLLRPTTILKIRQNIDDTLEWLSVQKETDKEQRNHVVSGVYYTECQV